MTDRSVRPPYHPDRDGCDCLRLGVMEEDECVHQDPCWISRAVYEKTLPKSEPYIISDERLVEIRAMVNADYPARGVDTYHLAGAVYDLLSERDSRLACATTTEDQSSPDSESFATPEVADRSKERSESAGGEQA